MNTVIQPKKATPLFVVSFLFACFAFSSAALAVSPPPDGGYLGANTAEGDNALFSLSETDGSFNTAIGWYSLFYNVTGSFNTAVGAGALDLNTSHNNTAVGGGALFLNTTGTGNTATGAFALVSNSTGDGNTAVGGAALFFNDNGAGNTAVGGLALLNNVGGPGAGDGSLNTAVGLEALSENTTGAFNTAVGAGITRSPAPVFAAAALGSNTTGAGNTAVGARSQVGPAALGSNTTGDFNTAVGQGALRSNTAGGTNTAIGAQALSHLGEPPKCSPSPSCIPSPIPTPGNDNIAVGVFAGSNLITGSNNIYIGNGGFDPESNTIRIGDTQTATFIAGISGATASGGAAVFVNTNGQLGTITSSARFKDEIKPMDKASTAILALKPVTFRYKKGIDPQRIPQFGLVAEEVEKVSPDLVMRDKEGKPYTVRYEAVNAMLLNEFLKARRQIDAQQKQIESLTAGLQKVSAQLELNKAAPETVANNQ